MDRPFEQLFNLRDLGGLPTTDGRVVASGLVYRADGIHRASDADRRRLREMGLRTVVDLRSQEEVDTWGRYPIEDHPGEYHLRPLLSEMWTREMVEAMPETDRFLAARYVEMAENAGFHIRAILEAAAHPGAHALLFHCHAGKDRTGLVAALLLSALDVDEEAIVADYARTADNMPAMFAWLEARDPTMVDRMADQPHQFLGCPPEAIRGFLDSLRVRHGSIDGYFDAIGVVGTTRERLRTTLLRPA